MTDELITEEEAARFLSTTPRHMRRLRYEQRISFTKMGNKVRYSPKDLSTFIAKNHTAAKY